MANYFSINIDIKAYYPSLKKSQRDNLLGYINDNFGDYFNVLLELKGNNEEEEKALSDIANQKSVTSELLSEFIDKQTNKIVKLENIGYNEIREIIFDNNKIKPT